MSFWTYHLKLLGRNTRQRKIRTDKTTVAKTLYWGLRAHIQNMNCYEMKTQAKNSQTTTTTITPPPQTRRNPKTEPSNPLNFVDNFV